MRPKRSSAWSTMRSAVAGSDTSPATVSRPGSAVGVIVRDVATTAHSLRRYPSTIPAPMPCDPPVTIATFPVGVGSRADPPTGVAGVRGERGRLDAHPGRLGQRREDRLHLVAVVRPPEPERAVFTGERPEPAQLPVRGQLVGRISLLRTDGVDGVRSACPAGPSGGTWSRTPVLRRAPRWSRSPGVPSRVVRVRQERLYRIGPPHAQRHGEEHVLEFGGIGGVEQAEGAPFARQPGAVARDGGGVPRVASSRERAASRARTSSTASSGVPLGDVRGHGDQKFHRSLPVADVRPSVRRRRACAGRL